MEFISLLAAILAFVSAFIFQNVILFKTFGVIVLVINLIGVISGGIKYVSSIFYFVIVGISVAFINKFDIFTAVLLSVCAECVYTYLIKMPLTLIRIFLITKTMNRLEDKEGSEEQEQTEKYDLPKKRKSSENGFSSRFYENEMEELMDSHFTSPEEE